MTKNRRVKFITGSQASITPKKTRKINKPKKKYQITKNTKKNPNVLSGTNNLKSSKRRKKNNAKRKQRIQQRVEANRKKANT
tara:strand:+ start:74 stop:319 length:246 start_codon:yes stop_codon:yes gene_type:complete